MNLTRKIGIAVVFAFVGIQFIQPARNDNGQVRGSALTITVDVPADIRFILQRSCYDCHSNHTVYPWYSWIQPGAWFMNHHILKGKSELNFNDFGSYSPRKQQSKLKAISNSIRKNEMPLSSYTLIHRNARLTQTEKDRVIAWSYSLINKE